jgi:hypothetical protein
MNFLVLNLSVTSVFKDVDPDCNIFGCQRPAIGAARNTLIVDAWW